MQPRHVVAAVACALLLGPMAQPAAAHHSFAAEFDATQPVTLRGTITKLEWINPHSWLHVDVKNEDGTTTPWMIEGATPNTLLDRRTPAPPTAAAPRTSSSVPYGVRSGGVQRAVVSK
jgi:hypothetical protein